MSFRTSQIKDGNETLSVVKVDVYSQPENIFVTDISTDSIPIQLEQIAEWVNQKFGSLILENSCAICKQYNTPVLAGNTTDNSTSPVNSTDNSTVVDNTTVVDNSTQGSTDAQTGDVPQVVGFFNPTNYTLPANCAQ
jgi:hypothetical protein